MRKQFITYYSSEIKHQIDSGKAMDDIEVDLRLSKIKPLHAQWLISLYNHFTAKQGKAIILKGWEKAGIVDLLNENTVLTPDDPYEQYYK